MHLISKYSLVPTSVGPHRKWQLFLLLSLLFFFILFVSRCKIYFFSISRSISRLVYSLSLSHTFVFALLFLFPLSLFCSVHILTHFERIFFRGHPFSILCPFIRVAVSYCSFCAFQYNLLSVKPLQSGIALRKMGEKY